MAIITQTQPYEAQDNFWDRVRKPIGAGLMARGTPLGLLLGALLGAAKAPSDVKAEQDAEMRRRDEASQRDFAKQSAQVGLGNSLIQQKILQNNADTMPERNQAWKDDRAEQQRQRRFEWQQKAGDVYDATKDPQATFDATGVPPSIRNLVAPVPVPGMTPMGVPGAGMPVVAPQPFYPKLTGNSVADSYKQSQIDLNRARERSLLTPKPKAGKVPTSLQKEYDLVYADLRNKKVRQEQQFDAYKSTGDNPYGKGKDAKYTDPENDAEIGKLEQRLAAIRAQMDKYELGDREEAAPAGETKTIDFNSW